MARLNRSDDIGANREGPGRLTIPQGRFRTQQDVIGDSLLQLGGRGEVLPGSGTVNDPLNAPFVLYVNPYTGRDTFAFGSYSTAVDASIPADERDLARIESQRLECGYTEAAPFRTINRAVIEAGLITSKAYWTNGSVPFQRVCIVLAPGVYDVLCAAGVAAGNVGAWQAGDNDNVDDAWLTRFNPASNANQTKGGLIIPRGCSVVSMDLRKTILRPVAAAVPVSADERTPAQNYDNRAAILRVTGESYLYGFTFMDADTVNTSHHLLSCFEFAYRNQVDEFYTKIRNAFETAAELAAATAVARETEWQIVGPQPANNPTQATDTTDSASPYIYNCSIRSTLGLCGVFANGNPNFGGANQGVGGFRSMVIAQFTGTCLQNDMTCWQVYNNAGNWVNLQAGEFDDYRDEPPNDTRMNPRRRSFHVRAVENAIIQEVSVFAIGLGVHHWTESGGELSITNSNSNFGSCAAIADGYKAEAFDIDDDWAVRRIRVAGNINGEEPTPTIIALGVIADGQANDATTIELTEALRESATTPGVPDLLAVDGYTFRDNSFIWVENANGEDFRARLTATAWDPANPTEIDVRARFENQDRERPGEENANGIVPSPLAGRNVYIRRIKDPRRSDERRYSLILQNASAQTRTPKRDYVLQTSVGGAGIAANFGANEAIVIAKSAPEEVPAGFTDACQVELRRANPNNTWAASTFYRVGDPVQHLNKHWICQRENRDAAFNADNWQENYVHMPEAYRPEDFLKNDTPEIIFDNDTDGNTGTDDCGYNFATVWTTDAQVREQYRSATDYRGLHLFLTALGFSAANAHTILLPRPLATRDRDPGAQLDGIGAPSDAANAWANWAVELRRPSTIRMYSHSWEWSGWLNYTKALPAYQRQLSEANKFTYYFTNEDGGRVFATGFNEEGFQVTPAGFTDITSGDFTSIENIGNRDVDLDIPAFFENLTVRNLDVLSTLDLGNTAITGTVNWTGNIRIDLLEVLDLLRAERIIATTIRPIEERNPQAWFDDPFTIFGNLAENTPNVGDIDASTTQFRLRGSDSFARYKVECSFYSGSVGTDPLYVEFIFHVRASQSGQRELTRRVASDPDSIADNLTIAVVDNNTGGTPENSYTITITHTGIGTRAYSNVRITRTG